MQLSASEAWCAAATIGIFLETQVKSSQTQSAVPACRVFLNIEVSGMVAPRGYFVTACKMSFLA